MTRTAPVRRRHVAALSAAALVAGVSLATLASPALAAVNDHFELEGNVLDGSNPDPDWGAPESNSIFVLPSGYNLATASPTPVARSPLPTTFFDAGFAKDFIVGSTADTSAFTGGGSKDIEDISLWKCKSESNTTDKGDIQNAYSAVATDPVTGNLLLYFGMEKNAPNGNNNMGVWFLQDPDVACDGADAPGGGKPFTGVHTDGDILLVAAFTNGGSTPQITAYQWDDGALVSKGTGGACGSTNSANLCAITNDTTNVTTPWTTTNKGSATPQNKTGQGTTLFPDQFYEGAVDLTANGLTTNPDTGEPVCVNRFLFNTRSSQETTAILYDYAAGDVETCASPEIDTLLREEAGVTDPALPATGDHTVTLPASVYDTATITGGFPVTNGTVTYSLWTDNECTVASENPEFANGTNAHTVNIGSDGTIPPSPTLVFSAAGNYWWQAEYTPGQGSRNDGAVSACTSEPLIVERPSPTIVTDASDNIVIGGGNDFNDTATISGGYFPDTGVPAPGTVTFNLYGPFAADATLTATSCVDTGTGTNLLRTETVNATRVSNTEATATSADYVPTVVGKYQWTAKYNGNDQNNATAFVGCGVLVEQVVVAPATPSIATKILLSDTAKVTGATGAGTISGSVVFSLHPSSDCTGEALYLSGAVALVNGSATTPQATAVVAGTYSWKVVFTPTAGSNYTGVTTGCSPADEQASITYGGTSPIPAS
ncbi:MAG TPA: hypothetical protein VE503_03275 [Ornithinibacter sp.]|nr:hypothetical protein [Ornithinibacter sp.]